MATSNSPAFIALENLLNNKRLLTDLPYLIHFCHTGNLEVFHSLLNKYCSKPLHLGLYGMIARTQLAVLDYNSGVDCKQAVTKEGDLRYKQCFSKVTQTWVVKRINKKKKEHNFIKDLMISLLEMSSENL